LAFKESCGLETEKRNSRTLKEFLGEIGMSGREFVTDNDEAYYQLIPKDQL
jgi:hypothetical protein